MLFFPLPDAAVRQYIDSNTVFQEWLRVRAHVAAHLAPFKVPAHVLISTEPLPRNVVGKALKRQLQQQFAAAQPR